MPDLLRRAEQWLDAQRAAHMATPVEYRRGPLSYAVAATFGRTEADGAPLDQRLDNGFRPDTPVVGVRAVQDFIE